MTAGGPVSRAWHRGSHGWQEHDSYPDHHHRGGMIGWADTPPPSDVPVPSLEWHKGRHPWDSHDGFPRHQHSINGVLTIAPGDTSLHFAGGLPFTDVAENKIGDSVAASTDYSGQPLLAARAPAAVHWTVRDCLDNHDDPRTLVPHDHYVAAEPASAMPASADEARKQVRQTERLADLTVRAAEAAARLESAAARTADRIRKEGEQRIRAAGGNGAAQTWNIAVRVVPGTIQPVLEAIERLPDASVYRSWMIGDEPLLNLSKARLARLRKAAAQTGLTDQQAFEDALEDWLADRS